MYSCIELDEFYFDPHRVRGKRGRGSYGGTIVFEFLKCHCKVYTKIVSDCSKATLQSLIRGKVNADSVICSDRWRGYDGLVDLGYDKHFRVRLSHNEFACGENHINGIESFWSYAKLRLTKFNDISYKTFYLHIKETELRFNHRHGNRYLEILKRLKNQHL